MSAGPPRAGHSGVLYIALGSVLFALVALLARSLAGKVPAAQILAVRFSLSLLFMAAWFAVLRRGLSLAHPRELFLRGLFGGVGAASYFYAIEQLGVGPATVLNFLAPCWAAVLAQLFLKERSSAFAWLGLAVATLGAALVTLSAGELHRPEHFWLAAALGVLSGICGGAAMTTLKRLRDDTDAGTIFTIFNVVGLLVIAPFAWSKWVPLEGPHWPALVAIALASVGAQLIYSWGMGFTTVAKGSLTTLLTPVFAATFGAVFLSELPNLTGVAGGLLCIGGVGLGLIRVGTPATVDASATPRMRA